MKSEGRDGERAARGRFITLEGVDGAGKSTHLGWLVANLQRRGYRVVQTREPGGTTLGEQLRELLLNMPMDSLTEALLMFAARREHLVQVILPALARGDWVVCDRFTDASFAYQGGGRRVAFGRLAVLEEWVQQGLQPDLTLLFDLPVSIAQQRIAQMQRSLDRFENERLDFFVRVREAYLARAATEERIKIIDASQSLENIRKQLEEILISIC